MGAIRRQLPHSWHSKPGVSRLVCQGQGTRKKIPDHRLENRDTDGGRKEAQFPVVRQAMEKDIMIKDFNVSEKGHGSYSAARHSPMGDGSYLCFVRHTEIHAPVRRQHCIIHFQQSVRFVAVYLRDQRRGLSARHYRVNDSRSSRCRRIYPGSIGTRLIDGTWYVCDYVVVFLLDTRCRQMERIHRPNSVEPYRGILVQRCRPSLCLYRVVFGITAKESRPPSVELISRCWRGDSRLSN